MFDERLRGDGLVSASSRAVSGAGSTRTIAVLFHVRVCCEIMAVFAVCQRSAARIYTRAIDLCLDRLKASPNIFGWSHWLQMTQVAAGSIAAQVVEFKAFRHGSVSRLVEHSVRRSRMSCNTNASISRASDAAGPRPACVWSARLVYEVKQSFFYRAVVSMPKWDMGLNVAFGLEASVVSLA